LPPSSDYAAKASAGADAARRAVQSGLLVGGAVNPLIAASILIDATDAAGTGVVIDSARSVDINPSNSFHVTAPGQINIIATGGVQIQSLSPSSPLQLQSGGDVDIESGRYLNLTTFGTGASPPTLLLDARGVDIQSSGSGGLLYLHSNTDVDISAGGDVNISPATARGFVLEDVTGVRWRVTVNTSGVLVVAPA
jgi:hypothetical protein